ncbi:PepSY domain-containing protein [Corynebacterium sp. UMB6689]|uniref:PepSY domain-containing protein n=1 Tax=Corynebacterium sp. UMB6689 TaxID=3046341 RepID=UPI00254E7190|nr:PepSY domain-containing protein [Corynebacterium sp. UMB6689]MDK6812760.1 PepSY domain-containing protein [Corynebacterium sp. UMB6689]
MTLRSRFTAAGIALFVSTALVACSSDKEADPAPTPTPAPVETVTETAAATGAAQGDDDDDDRDDDAQQPADTAGAGDAGNAENSGKLTGDEAFEKALAHAGVDAQAVTEKEVDYDDGDDGKGPHWEIDFKANGQEHELDVDATSGAVTQHEVD